MDDEASRPVLKIMPLENIYAYFLFVMPIESGTAPGTFSWKKVLASLTVCVCLSIKLVFLFCLWDAVVVADQSWRVSIVDSAPAECNKGQSLCVRQPDGMYTCAPPSVQLAGRWDELDIDGNDIWELHEAFAMRKTIQCSYAVDPVEVFRVFVSLILDRQDVLWIHPDVLAGEALPKAYFTFAAGDVIMCGYRNEDMCANLLRRGFFDGPLKNLTSPRVGETIDSAIDYCYDLLAGGGLCERSLPATYSVWRRLSVDQCQGASYAEQTYTNPRDGSQKVLLEVDYSARELYNRHRRSNLFLVYKSCILAIYLMALVFELRHIIVGITFCLNMTADTSLNGEKAVQEIWEDEATVKYKVVGISMGLRVTMGIFTVVRCFILASLSVVGTMFVLKNTEFIDLLMDGVGLLFVVQVSEIIYMQILSSHIKSDMDNTEPMVVDALGPGWLHDRPALKDLLWFATLAIATISIMTAHHFGTVRPLAKALECACLNTGSYCVEAEKFSANFWADYWNVQMPQVFEDIEALKSDSQTAAKMMNAAYAGGGGLVRHHRGEAPQQAFHATEAFPGAEDTSVLAAVAMNGAVNFAQHGAKHFFRHAARRAVRRAGAMLGGTSAEYE